MTSTARLHEFLEGYARKPELLPPAFDLIRPFYRPTEPPTYGLAAAGDIDVPRLMDALSLARGKPLRRIRLVSIAHVCDRLKLRQPQAAGESAVQYGLRLRLQDRLWHSLGNDLWESCGKRLWAGFPDGFGRRLVWEIQNSLGANRLDSLLYGMRDVVGDCFVDGLFYYLGAVASGDADLAERLTPLMRLLPQAVPLGEKSGAPETWYVLTA